ncbi:nucleotidyltransferase domain-containing protein [uncultured Nonlabens sp.]|uniref:DNA polymerase beta superfamily protein n=1 Tax=uncultured Nonlabens sp. TaxID=859306 RepID=UPI00261C7799|nr:nucleotidyltransferase domain-containing protein [uncultured Nonlabens sp.]
MTIDYLKENNLIILECISGSKAYGLNTPTSDTDIKGVFILPKESYYSLNYVPQVSNQTNDIVYFELGRFMELLSVNNPNILELLNTPKSAILYKHPYLERIDSKKILSKLCKNTFGKFALSQIKKAKGLKKKIMNPIGKERKSILSFCYVNHNKGSISLIKYLELKKWKQEHCGLINISHMKDVYGLFYNENVEYKGIIKNDYSNDVSLSSIPKEEDMQTILYFNKDGYSKYCKEYKEYWNWVEKRNDDRYESTQSHGKNYDAKNMMHTFRLLEMAIEIGKDAEINVVRPNRNFLLDIKNGKFEYDDLLSKANKLQDKMTESFETSSLSETPDIDYINNLLFELREQFYSINLE